MKLGIHFTLGVLLCSACVPQRAQHEPKSPIQKQALDPDSDMPALQLLDPALAEVSLSSSVKVDAKDFGSAFKVPTFSLDFIGNDYVQILRCSKDYRNLLIAMQAELSHYPERAKSVWVDSFGLSKVCKIASLKAKATGHRMNEKNESVGYLEFQDIASPNGSYFYLINPCVSQEFSSEGKTGCSYKLISSEDYEFRESLSQVFADKANELTAAEDKYDDFIIQLKRLTYSLADYRAACLNDFQSREEARNQKNAAIYIGTAALASTGSLLGAMSYARAGKTSGRSTATTAAIGTLFTLASSMISLFNVLDESPVAPGIACEKAEAISAEILQVKNNPSFEKAKQEILKISRELEAMNKEFRGYDASMFAQTEEGAKTRP